MTRMLLVRHGQSEWNAVGRWQGQADPPLSDLGRHQATIAAKAVGAVDGVFASDLQRASETAAIISGQLGVGPLVVDADLRERDAGEWSGLTRAEINEQFPGYLHDERRSGFGPTAAGRVERRPPGWEPDDELRGRALAALDRIQQLVPDGDVLVVTHGGLVYVLEEHLGAAFERLANLAGRWVEHDGERLRLGERIHLVDPHDETIPAQI